MLGHHRHGGHDVQRIGRAEKTVERLLTVVKRGVKYDCGELPPHGRGVQFLIGQIDWPVADILVE